MNHDAKYLLVQYVVDISRARRYRADSNGPMRQFCRFRGHGLDYDGGVVLSHRSNDSDWRVGINTQDARNVRQSPGVTVLDWPLIDWMRPPIVRVVRTENQGELSNVARKSHQFWMGHSCLKMDVSGIETASR